MTRPTIRPHPHLAIDRLAALRRRIAALEAEAAAASEAILALPDGEHQGLAVRARIDRAPGGARRISLSDPEECPVARTDVPLPPQPDTAPWQATQQQS